jgi:tRNA (guanine10-N2)-dimethyltransferase
VNAKNQNKYLCVLGRQPKISLAELESLFGSDNVVFLPPNLAAVSAPILNINRLGGTIKAGLILDEAPLKTLGLLEEGKITLGVSDFRRKATAKTATAEALKLKAALKKLGFSVRTVPSQSATLSSAVSHHNKLGLSPHKVELLITDKFSALSIGAQNITSYAARDQSRPARDARVGMLPPKLAQILINLAGNLPTNSRVLDPFCGTGVVLQEALLMGYRAYGTDLEPKMIDYSRKNLDWLLSRKKIAKSAFELEQGDATTHAWRPPIDAVVSETYLGQPFSTVPSEVKMREVELNCRSIIKKFLRNLAPQISAGTPVVIAVPAWKTANDDFFRLKILDELDSLGYNLQRFKNLSQSDLLYYREDQIVARELLVLRRK